MYGMTKKTREIALQKIKKQKDFFEKNYFTVGNDVIKMSELIKNAYHNTTKYIAEVNQRVYSLKQYADNHNLKPIFGTITLPTEYHRLIGNKRRNPKYANMHLIPEIDRTYCIKTKKQVLVNYFDYKKYTPNGGAKDLSKIFKKLLDCHFLKTDIAKEDKCYFRVYEPHKDGTPHLHFSLFVPEDKLEITHEKITKYFKDNYPNQRTDFQIDIKNPVAYLMKYILKTFDDLRANPDDITDLSLWYIHNKITRFYTSRTLISLDVYRKLNGQYNLLELTYMYKNREISVLEDIDTKKVVSIYNSYGEIYSKKTVTLQEENKTIKLKYEKKKTPLIVSIDGEQYIQQKDGSLSLFEPIIPINQRTDLTLLTDYNELKSNDLNTIDMNEYNLIQNELINRELKQGSVTPLVSNEYHRFIDNEFITYSSNEYGF